MLNNHPVFCRHASENRHPEGFDGPDSGRAGYGQLARHDG